jgi:hypothetical protein
MSVERPSRKGVTFDDVVHVRELAAAATSPGSSPAYGSAVVHGSFRTSLSWDVVREYNTPLHAVRYDANLAPLADTLRAMEAADSAADGGGGGGGGGGGRTASASGGVMSPTARPVIAGGGIAMGGAIFSPVGRPPLSLAAAAAAALDSAPRATQPLAPPRAGGGGGGGGGGSARAPSPASLVAALVSAGAGARTPSPAGTATGSGARTPSPASSSSRNVATSDYYATDPAPLSSPTSPTPAPLLSPTHAPAPPPAATAPMKLIEDWHVKADGCIYQGPTEHSSPVGAVSGKVVTTRSGSRYVLGRLDARIEAVLSFIAPGSFDANDPLAPSTRTKLLYAERIIYGGAAAPVAALISALAAAEDALEYPELVGEQFAVMRKVLRTVGIDATTPASSAHS